MVCIVIRFPDSAAMAYVVSHGLSKDQPFSGVHDAND